MYTSICPLSTALRLQIAFDKIQFQIAVIPSMAKVRHETYIYILIFSFYFLQSSYTRSYSSRLNIQSFAVVYTIHVHVYTLNIDIKHKLQYHLHSMSSKTVFFFQKLFEDFWLEGLVPAVFTPFQDNGFETFIIYLHFKCFCL